MKKIDKCMPFILAIMWHNVCIYSISKNVGVLAQSFPLIK